MMCPLRCLREGRINCSHWLTSTTIMIRKSYNNAMSMTSKLRTVLAEEAVHLVCSAFKPKLADTRTHGIDRL
jgi:hypothetical protein